ncbi:MFS transporter [Neobacillus drentensis]|uniref:MFS transporter n=1 Tax=Neobacillus drentensis TaxID=220684 RepID=UPI002FFE0461
MSKRKNNELLNQTNMKTSRYAWVMMLFLFFLAFINNLDKAVIGIASVPIMKELHLNPTEWGLVGSSFYWLFAISAIVVGGMADTRSSKKLIIWLCIIWASVQFLTLVIIGLPSLIFTRIVLGAGEGPAIAVAAAVIGKWLPKEKYAIGFAFIFLGTLLGPAIGSPILLSLMSTYGWRSAFLTTGILGLVLLVFWIIFAKESPKELGLPSPSQSETQSQNTTSIGWRQFFKIIATKNFILIILTGMASYWLLALNLIWFPNFYENVKHFEGSRLKLAVSLPFLITAVLQFIIASLSDRSYRKTKNIRKSRIVYVGTLMFLSAIGLFLATIVKSSLLSMILLSVSPGLCTVSLVLLPAILFETVSDKNIGKAQGVFTSLSTIASIIAPLVFGAIIQKSTSQAVGFNHGFQITALLMLIIGILFWIGVRPESNKIVANQSSNKTF